MLINNILKLCHSTLFYLIYIHIYNVILTCIISIDYEFRKIFGKLLWNNMVSCFAVFHEYIDSRAEFFQQNVDALLHETFSCAFDQLGF